MDNTASMFDVVISGGGLIGCLTALSLSECKKSTGEKLNIAIVEANAHANQTKVEQTAPIKNAALSFDDRVLALSHSTVAYLKKLGLNDFEQASSAIETIHISDQGYYGKARVYAHQHQVSALGQVIKMSILGESFIKALSAKTNVTWFSPDTIDKLDWETTQVNITLASGIELTSKLLLGCDGANSVCRRLANIGSAETSYQQSALITNITPEFAHQNVAYERFTPSGPIAVLPLSNVQGEPRCSVVWTLTPEMAKTMQNQSDELLKTSLENSFGQWLGKIKHMGKCDIYPLKLVQAEQQVYHRMVLLGNASHTIHPIAGQGFNLGVRDVEQLSQSLQQVLLNATGKQKTHDIGSLANLMHYAQIRGDDHRDIITLTDSLVTLFSNKHMPLVISRNVGLKVLNYVKPLKDILVKKTMGY